jgi:hypothetical protein
MHTEFVRKSEVKVPHGQSQHRQEDNIKMGLRELGCGGVDWVHLTQWQLLVNMVVNFQDS